LPSDPQKPQFLRGQCPIYGAKTLQKGVFFRVKKGIPFFGGLFEAFLGSKSPDFDPIETLMEGLNIAKIGIFAKKGTFFQGTFL